MRPDFSRDRAAQPAPQDRRHKVKQRIRALRAFTLTEELELDEATAAKLFPALAKYDEEFDKLLLTRTDLQRRLGSAHEINDARAVDKLIDEAVANQRAFWDTEDKRLAQLRKILTPAQTARLLVVLPATERKIQNQLRSVVKKPATAGRQELDPFDQGGERGERGGHGGDFVDPFRRRIRGDNLERPDDGPRLKPVPRRQPAQAAEGDPFAGSR